MQQETYDLFKGVAAVDIAAVERALANGADVNASDEFGRNILHYAALGSAINSFEEAVQPRLSERRIQILRLVVDAPGLSLYSLNAPLPWADGVTLLGLLAWLNMPSEIMCLLESAQGLLEVDAMDDHGATPLMYAARDGNIQVVRRLLAYGARPDIRDISRCSAIQYALPHPEILWLCEEALRRSRISEDAKAASFPRRRRKYRPTTPFPGIESDRIHEDLFFSDAVAFPSPPLSAFNEVELKRLFDTLLAAVRSEDVDLLHKTLIRATSWSVTQHRSHLSAPYDAPLLVNFRDNTGLALIHHALSHRHSLNIAVIDALHNAGADVGLCSCLGFTPLHHLARTAKEADAYKEVPVYKRPLYAFTMHLIQDLRAPLAATDNKGETPLHAAAEHGRSISVLQAMLDSDKAYFGKASVREARNTRELRPVDVAKPEFLPVFVGDNLARFDVPTVPEVLPHTPGTGSSSSERARSVLRRSKSFRSDAPNSRPLGSKTSMASLVSSSSSGSSSNQSYNLRYQKPPPNRKMLSSAHSLPTPDPTPPGSFSSSFTSTSSNFTGIENIDVQSHTVDLLHNLSLCASVLQVYRQPGSKQRALTDIDELLDNLFQCRLLISQILEYWAAKLDKLQDNVNRTRAHILKTGVLRKRILKDIQAVHSQIGQPAKFPRTSTEYPDQSTVVVPAQRTLTLTVEQPRMDTGSSGETIQPDNLARDDSTNQSSAVATLPSPISDADTMTLCDRSQSTPTPGRVMPKGSGPSSPVGRPSRIKFPDTDPAEQERNIRWKQNVLNDMQTGLRNAPTVLQRAEADIRYLSKLFDNAQRCLQRSDRAIQVARDLADEAITIREKQLDSLRRVYYNRSTRLPPIEERSADGHLSPHTEARITSLDDQLEQHDETLEEPHVLRHILTVEIQRLIETITFDLQKTQVWSRIIREVLRGTRRRVRFPLSHS